MDTVLIIKNPIIWWHSVEIACNGRCESCCARFKCYTSRDGAVVISYDEAKRILDDESLKWVGAIFEK